MKNWRPITLLNTSYKIASSVLANRIKPIMSKLIHEDQTGFITGRYKGDNTRLIYDILNYTDEKDIPGLLLLIDFEKAFDSVSWKFLSKVLQYFNFGESFQYWINTLYKNIFSRVNQCGFLSDIINLQRGCRQGDPISSYLFILCAEILAIKIRNDKDIKGICIDRFEYKISQYADDTTLLLDGSEKSLNKSLDTLAWFETVSGLKVNFDKTQVVWIGGKKYSTTTMCNRWKLKWGQSSFKLLGINFDVDIEKIGDINYTERLKKMENTIKQWKKRKITPIGKIAVVKSLLISQFNHLFLSLPNPKESTLLQLKRCIFNFIWDDKRDKVKRETLCKNYEEGGLNMLDIDAYISSLKTTWVRKILNIEGIWQNLLFQNIKKDFLLKCGDDYIEKCISSTKNQFWKDVFLAWKCVINKQINAYPEEINIAKMPLWFNKEFKVGGISTLQKQMYDNGYVYVNDILKENNSLFTYEEFKSRINFNLNFIEFLSIRSAVLNFVRKNRTFELQKIFGPFKPIMFELIVKSRKGGKDMYKVLTFNSFFTSGVQKWSNLINPSDINKWRDIHKSIKYIQDPKMKWFQYRINRNILTTNKTACQMRIRDDPNCTFCKNSIESITHLFWDCPLVKELYQKLNDLLINCDIQINLNSKKMVILGPYKQNVESLIIVSLKYYIYLTKCKESSPNLQSYILYLKSLYQTYRYALNASNKIELFHSKYASLGILFDE